MERYTSNFKTLPTGYLGLLGELPLGRSQNNLLPVIPVLTKSTQDGEVNC